MSADQSRACVQPHTSPNLPQGLCCTCFASCTHNSVLACTTTLWQKNLATNRLYGDLVHTTTLICNMVIYFDRRESLLQTAAASTAKSKRRFRTCGAASSPLDGIGPGKAGNSRAKDLRHASAVSRPFQRLAGRGEDREYCALYLQRGGVSTERALAFAPCLIIPHHFTLPTQFHNPP